jgi:DNA-binding response OmpR family regulator
MQAGQAHTGGICDQRRTLGSHALTSAPNVTGRVLIIDDDDMVRHIFMRILTDEGYEVRVAASADSGLLETALWHPDALIIDLKMPFINGLGFLYRMRERAHLRHTPVVIVTGEGPLQDSVREEIHALGADVVFKPLWRDDLLRLVHTLIATSHPDDRSAD